MATITGIVGTVIAITCTVSDDGQPIAEGESAATAQACMSGLATIKSGNCTIGGNKTFSGALTASSTAHIVGTITADAGLDVGGATVLNSTLEVSGASTLGACDIQGVSTFESTFTPVGSAAIRPNRAAGVVTAGSATFTISCSSDSWYSKTPTPSGNLLTITIKSTSPVPPANARIEWTGYNLGINSVRLFREDSSQVIRFDGGDIVGFVLEFTSGSWRLVSYTANATTTATIGVVIQ